jgi:hypothetical protein
MFPLFPSSTRNGDNQNRSEETISRQPAQLSPIFNREQVNLESHQLIWLDVNTNGREHTNSRAITIRDLRKIVDYTKLFDNIKNCEQYLNNTTSSCSTFFVFSGKLEQIVMQKFDAFKDIHKMYIYCQNKERYKQWTPCHKQVHK